MTVDDDGLEALGHDLARYRSVAAPAALRSRVRAEIIRAPSVPSAPRGAFSFFALRSVLAAFVVVAVLASAGGAAAAGSLPGDPAFGLKRAVEDLQAALTIDDSARLDVLLAQLDRRLTDLERVAGRPPATAIALEEYAAALARVDLQREKVVRLASSPVRDAALARAAAEADAHIARLRALAGTLPAETLPGLERAIDAHERLRVPPSGPVAPGASATPARPSFAPGAPPIRTVPAEAPGARPTGPAGPARTAAPTRP